MKVITGSRGSGVSTELLNEAQKTGGIYICGTKARARDLNQKYNNPNIKFITMNEIAHSKPILKFEHADIYIDDFELALAYFFIAHGYGGKIKTIGTTWGIDFTRIDFTP